MRVIRSALIVFASVCGCITSTVVNIGQKTTLERQLIGDFDPLTEEELLVSSVRAGGGIGAGTLDDLQQRAVFARRRQLFNQDDLQEFKRAGCLGETFDAQLVFRPCDAGSEADTRARIDKVVGQENADRAAIVDWAIEADPVLAPSDRPEVLRLFATLLRELSMPGDWVQGDDGSWRQHATGAP